MGAIWFVYAANGSLLGTTTGRDNGEASYNARSSYSDQAPTVRFAANTDHCGRVYPHSPMPDDAALLRRLGVRVER